ncbi:MAG: hypothetical protein CFE43_19190 [Burkholderiales bacterium PBB3]|nr:MAG: hypothetical protein CFE43_19190 [Burkholderiales bacterium PBB3]
MVLILNSIFNKYLFKYSFMDTLPSALRASTWSTEYPAPAQLVMQDSLNAVVRFQSDLAAMATPAAGPLHRGSLGSLRV